MAKFQDDQMLNVALSAIADNVTLITVCSGQPTTYAAATSAVSGANGFEVARTVVSGADFTIADGDSSGRKVTIGQQTSLTVSATGGANHIALCSQASSRLWYVTTATSQNLTSGNQLTINAWDIEIADAT